MMQILITILGHPFRFATPENQWRELFWKELPPWLTVQDEKALVPLLRRGIQFLYQTPPICVAPSRFGIHRHSSLC